MPGKVAAPKTPSEILKHSAAMIVWAMTDSPEGLREIIEMANQIEHIASTMLDELEGRS